MQNMGLLVLRLTAGGLLAGHGGQKLFGWFGGHGFQGTSGWMESMNLKPGKAWATAAGAGEFGGGTLLALGLLNPLGSLGVIGAMAMGTMKAHWGKPIWVTSGGAELPVTNIAIATALILTGPGAISLDRAFHIRLPRWISLLGLAGVAGSLVLAKAQEQQAKAEQAAQEQLTVSVTTPDEPTQTTAAATAQ